MKYTNTTEFVLQECVYVYTGGKKNSWMEGAAWDIPSPTAMKNKATQMTKLCHVLFICSLHHENTHVKDWTHYDLREQTYLCPDEDEDGSLQRRKLISFLIMKANLVMFLMVLWERVLCLGELNKVEWESSRLKSGLGMIRRC